MTTSPPSRDRDGNLRHAPAPAARPGAQHDPVRTPGDGVAGRAQARRVASAGLADLADRQAKAVAALDRALEARLGEFDRAVDTRRKQLEGRLSEAEGRLAEAIDGGIGAFKHAASDERRLLGEEAAAQLADLDRAVRQHLRELEDAATTQVAALRNLIDRVHELEQAAAARVRDLGVLAEGHGGADRPRRGDTWVTPG